MTPNELAGRLSGISERAEEALGVAVTKTQRQLFNKMQGLLAKLELDGDGLIKQSTSNRKILQKADKIFDQAIRDSGYYGALSRYVDNFNTLAKAQEKYFDFIVSNFTIDSHYLKSLQSNAVKTVETYLANDGLASQIKQPLNQILNQNINTGGAFSDLLQQVREFIKGTNDREGKLMRYSKQIARDSLFDFNRSLQESISENAGLEFYQYLGGIMDDTRPFCAERSNKFYHKKEIESWPRLNWQGKRPGTTSSTIFVFAGGFSCLHMIVPVSEAIVPTAVKKRAEELGFYRP